jgi:hypothetical protein
MLTDDPIRDEERRQAEWDRKCDAAPRCCHCNSSIYPHDTYLEIDGMIYCEPCVAYGTKYVDDLEV